MLNTIKISFIPGCSDGTPLVWIDPFLPSQIRTYVQQRPYPARFSPPHRNAFSSLEMTRNYAKESIVKHKSGNYPVLNRCR